MREFERVQMESRSQWRAWLAARHTQKESIWLVRFKKGKGPVAGEELNYDQIVEEALCFGWVDSLPRALDEDRTMLLLSPRKAKSPWSKLNKTRVAKMIKAGLMTPAGLTKINQSKADGSWEVYDQAESLEVPEDLRLALAKNAKARATFEAFSPSSRKGILWWLASAKREQTRATRVGEVVRLAAMGLRANFPESRGK